MLCFFSHSVLCFAVHVCVCCLYVCCLQTGLNLASIGAETDRRGFVPVNEKMEVVGKDGKVVPNVYCIGDANGKYMLAHAASAQVGFGGDHQHFERDTRAWTHHSRCWLGCFHLARQLLSAVALFL